jgi:probable rRNA maturation factor
MAAGAGFAARVLEPEDLLVASFASHSQRIVVQIDAGAWPRAPRRILQRAVRATCHAQDIEDAELSIALVDDAAIDALAHAHLGKDGPTDVLAFALYQQGEPVLGDVYVGLEQARRQAAEAGVSLREELVRLVIHGTLHVLGWDHPEDATARAQSAMYVRQEALVRAVLESPRSPSVEGRP